MQPHPGQNVLAGDEVLVIGLVHVPEESNLRHTVTCVIRCTSVAADSSISTEPAAAPCAVLKILDRYLIREIALPFCLGLVVLTFVLEIPPILREAEALVAKGVEWRVVFRVLLTLLPQALALTIPMAVLLGILVGFGRVSADREFVAMQACGVSLLRLARPVSLVALLATAATAHQIIVALPDANQTFREITFGIVATRVEQNVKPRVFFEDFPDRVIYIRDLPPEGGWRDVFLADTSRPDQTTVYFAREGRILIDRTQKLVQLQLIDGTSHTTVGSRPESYESTQFERIAINLDPETVFRRPPPKGPPEKTFAELRQTIDEAATQGQPATAERFMYQLQAGVAGDMSDPRADRPRARRERAQGRAARLVRPRVRGDPGLLRAAVRRAGVRDGRTPQSGSGPVDTERRHGRRRRPDARLALPVGGSADSASASRRSSCGGARRRTAGQPRIDRRRRVAWWSSSGFRISICRCPACSTST